MIAARNTRLVLTVAAIWAAAVCVLFPAPALAFAPMCDQSASTVVAPLVAPPEQSGEILPCPLALDARDFGRPVLHGDNSTPGERAPVLIELSASARHSFATPVALPRRVNDGECFDFAPVTGWERPGYARLIERPPC